MLAPKEMRKTEFAIRREIYWALWRRKSGAPLRGRSQVTCFFAARIAGWPAWGSGDPTRSAPRRDQISPFKKT